MKDKNKEMGNWKENSRKPCKYRKLYKISAFSKYFSKNF